MSGLKAPGHKNRNGICALQETIAKIYGTLKYRDIKQSKSDRLFFMAIKLYFKKGSLKKFNQKFQDDRFTLFKHRVFI